ncbi:MAG: hypothetical protein R3250_18085, partial [Melioribacteraceae bacterium]|nr:hypothetical protein [Melioribacteraceae bacterium]
MKSLIIVFSFFFFAGLLYSQPDTTIMLDCDVENFADPWQIALDAGKTVQFITTGAEFRILILNAYEIFEEAD